MAPRTITITEEAYERLASHQRRGETVSDVIERLAGPTSNPLNAAGTYPGLGTAVRAARAGLDDDLSRDP